MHNLLEHIRVKQKRYISHIHSNADKVMHIILLSQDLEVKLRQGLRQNLREIFFEINYSSAERIFSNLEELLSADSSVCPVKTLGGLTSMVLTTSPS